jgi:hypothetical protein
LKDDAPKTKTKQAVKEKTQMSNKSVRIKKSSSVTSNKKTHRRAKRLMRHKGEHGLQLRNYLLEQHPEL